MVKKVINVGVEGNDATGDPIREAFIKSNENFNELYSAIGQGDGISFTALSDTPNVLEPNKIFIVNSAGTRLISKGLEAGTGITIDITDPDNIIVSNTGASLINDSNPALGNTLNASGFGIARLGNPDPTVASSLGTTIDSFAINKGYADTRYLNTAGDTATGPISVPAGATGTQVARKEELVGRIGGTDNQMQGPLILLEDPDSTSDPLTAVTKNYVDTSSFASSVDFFVSTTGDDKRFDVVPEKRGRAWAYAFASLNRACQAAQAVVDSAAITLGPYQKPISYGNGAYRSTVSATALVSGDTYYLDISHSGSGTDPRQPPAGNYDIRAGLLIRGVVSGAIGRIDDIGSITQTPNSERYHIVYLSTSSFILGEQLIYGEPVKSPNITIFMESGTYYEHYPIRVPENVSIVGDELRRVIVRPRYGRSASPHADLYFRRDTTMDGLTLTTQTFGWHYLTDASKEMYTKTITNPGGFENASFLLYQNRDFIQDEVIGYIAEVLNGLDYDEATCRRDIGLIIDAIGYDMMFGSNFASIIAGRLYRTGTNGAQVVGFQKKATKAALNFLKTTLTGLVSGNATAVASINSNMTIIYNILDTGLSAVPATYVRPDPTNLNTFFARGRNLIYNNVTFIKAELIEFLAQNYPSLSYNADTCRRDIDLICQALYYDLTYGGNTQSRNAGLAYWLGTSRTIADGEVTPILEAYDYLKSLVYDISLNVTVDALQAVQTQQTGTPGNSTCANTVSNLVQGIIDTITNKGSVPTVSYPTYTWVDAGLQTAFNTLESAKTTTQDSVINYITSNFFLYNSTLCRRDAGLIVDAIAYDVFYGGNFKSLEAANSYFESASSLIAITTQLSQTEAALTYLGTIAQRIVQNLAPVTSYQSNYEQYINNTDYPVETGIATALTDLVTLHLDVINQDSSFNPPKDNDRMDVFQFNNANLLRNFSCQGHGGFMCVLDPLGQIITKSPYVQTCGSFSGSTNAQRFAGGMFVDAFCGNLQAQVVTRTSSTLINVNGLTFREPQTPFSFNYLGARFQVDYISAYNQSAGTATLHLNPGTPDSTSYHGLGSNVLLNGVNIELGMGGNRSMLANDFTQINDMGYGLVATNQGLIEAVSVFTYYCYTAYYSVNGAQIRSLNGSCAYGVNALKAEGADPTEVPDTVNLANDMVQAATAYTVSGAYPNIASDLTLYVNNYSYIPYNVSEVEIDHGTASTTTTQSILIGATAPFTLTVTSSASFNSSGTVKIDSEYFLYSANNTTTNTLTISARAQTSPAGASSAAGHSSGATIISIGNVKRYEVTNATSGGSLPAGVLALNLSTAGNNNTASTGLFGAVTNGTPVIIRSNQNFKFSNVFNIAPTKPSTALVFTGESSVYRVLAYGSAGLGANQAILTTRETYAYTTIISHQTAGTTSGSGQAGDTALRILNLTTSDAATIQGKKFGWKGTIHTITLYQSTTVTGQAYARITFTPALAYPINGADRNITLRAGLVASAAGTITVNISTMRATGHDMLDIGSGSFADSNYPNNIFGGPLNTPSQSKEVQEVGKGRVFYVTTDQDGNFRVGSFFAVNQGTGTVTFAASISLSNLDGIGFKRGVNVAEFSIDDTMTDNATDTVPTEQAVRGYIDKRLGKTHGGGTTSAPIGPGFIPRNGSLAATSNIDLGSQRIVNLSAPTDGSDGTNKTYVDLFVKRTGGVRSGVDTIVLSSSTVFTISTVARNGSNVATIVLTESHGLSTGSVVTVAGVSVTGFNASGVTVVATPTATSFTYANTGVLVTTTAVSGSPTVTTVSNIGMNSGKITNLATPTDANDAANKQYVIDLVATKDQLSELNDVTLTSAASNDVFMYNGTKWVNGAQTGDVTYAISGNTATSTIGSGKIVNSMVASNAAIVQSKLAMTAASTRTSTGGSGTLGAMTQADLGLATFDTGNFTASSGFISVKDNGIALTKLATQSAYTAVGNNTNGAATPTAVTFDNVVINGNGLYNSLFSSNGALVRTGTNAYSTVAYTSANTASNLVQRDSSGNFSAGTVNVSQLNLNSNKLFGVSSSTVEMYTQAGALALQSVGTGVTLNTTVSGTLTANTIAGSAITVTSITTGGSGTGGTITGAWTLTGTFEATYAADLAEYYEGDQEYEVGTVLMLGGDKEVTIAKGEGTRAVAGVVSNNAAYIMNGNCLGLKNLIALQGRVPCKVIGKINKGDLLVVSTIPGVAWASEDPKTGSIIGKAIENYDSDRIGTIEVMVGKH